jgi:hypothetical protein
MIEKEKNKLMTPLQKKLEVLKKKENSQNKSGSPNFFTEYMTKVKTQGMAIFEKFKHNIIPAIFISIIYYISWYVIFKIIHIIPHIISNAVVSVGHNALRAEPAFK